MEPMKFYEIGQSKFAQQAQDAFVKAHSVAFQSGEKVSVRIKIDVDPPDSNNPEFGNLSWEIDVKLPALKSIKHITRLSGGLPISDGTCVAEALQTNLFQDGKAESDGE